MFGKFFHLMVDATLVAMVLSGVRRTTGIVPSVHRVPNKDIRNILRAYLETGEWMLDFTIVFLGRSRYFERTIAPPPPPPQVGRE